jgi:hypothetical protein
VHSLASQQIVLGDLDGNGLDDIILDFGPDSGIWVWGNNTAWIHAHPESPEQMVAANLN